MDKLISVIIPTFREPSHLEKCIESLVQGQVNKNEIIVVCDGFIEENREVLTRWSEYIEVLDMETNQGLPRATNFGVYAATNSLVMVINDDNIAPYRWDERLLEDYKDGIVLTPNQIEPTPSMFKQFYIKDLGRYPETFSLEYFYEQEKIISTTHRGKFGYYIDDTGSTLPFLMSKKDYLMLGGWCEGFPPQGVCADWEFFMKASMAGLDMIRTYDSHFYHFGSVSTGTDRQEIERQGHEWARYKWGSYIQHENGTNKKYLAG